MFICKMRSKLLYYLPVAFIEGAAVMAVELIGAKLISPWFGSSLYVWAAVLGVTMMGLAGGYFAGGFLSEKMKSPSGLFSLLTLAAFFTALMPLSGPWIIEYSHHLDPRAGALLSACTFILPPMLLFGTISPMLIRLSTPTTEKTGRVSGTLYAVSTLGGVFATFLLGFYLIPLLGLKKPILLFAGLTLLPAMAYTFTKRFTASKVLFSLVGITALIITLAAIAPISDYFLPDFDALPQPSSPPISPIHTPTLTLP